MNQILFTGKKNDNVPVNKIIRVFCIVIIIFSICLIGKGIYGIVPNDDDKRVVQNVSEPVINVIVQGSTVTIDVKHDITINSIFYSWNNGKEMQISDVSGKNNVETKVQLPNEDTILKIRIVDSNKREYIATKEFKYDPEEDLEEPKLEISSTITVTESITVVATDNEEISYIAYKWDDDDEIRIENTGDDKKRMETQIDLQDGKSKLIVRAVDHNGNERSEQKDIVVVTPPEITLKRSKGELIIRVKDDEQVTKVVYEINGTQYEKDYTGENKAEVEIRELLSKGENIVKVTAYNNHGVTREKLGKCTY